MLDEASKGNQEQDQREILGSPREQAAMGWEKDNGAGALAGVSSLGLIGPNLPLLPPSQKAGVWVYLRKEQSYFSYFLHMFFCLCKPVLAYVRDLRDVCNRQKNLSMQEVCSVTQRMPVQAGWGCRGGATAKEERVLQSQSCDALQALSPPKKIRTRDGVLLPSL